MPFVNKIREILLRHPEVVTVVSQHGRPDDGSDAAGFFNAEFFVPLKPFDEWPSGYTKDKLIDDLQQEFNKEFVGIDFNFSQYIQDNVEEGLSGVKGANSVKIIGPDLATLEQLARAALREMAKVPGITDLGAFWVLGQPNLNISIDRAKAARYGLSVNDVNNVVQAALGGTQATTLLEADRQFGVVVRLAPRISQQYRRGAQHQGRRSDRERRRLHSTQRTRRSFRSIPARPISSASGTSVSYRSNSACAAAISRERSRRLKSASAAP